MNRWALMNGSTVAQVIEQDSVPQVPGNWVMCGGAAPGWVRENGQFKPPRVPGWNDVDLDPRYWWIDRGPFFDRFGAKALAIVSSTDPEVQGLITLLMPRLYVDLKRADLPALLDVLVGKQLLTAQEKVAILTTPTTEDERHVRGLVQPQ